jgi:hypothetical protein
VREAGHSPPSSAEIKNAWGYTLHRHNFILYFNSIPEAGFEASTMTMRRQLLNELKKTRSILVGQSGQRPHTTTLQPAASDLRDMDLEEVTGVKDYSEVPGPRELPFIGNAWRFLPYIGKFIDYSK